MKTFMSLVLLAWSAAAAQASVSCKINGNEIRVAEAMAHHDYSASGKKGASGHVSLFRLLTLDDSDGPTSSIELKTVDVSKPGDYRLSSEPGWTSRIRDRDDDQYVTSGRFRFTRFEPGQPGGRAVGTVEFTTGRASGSCSFDVLIQGINRDRFSS
jgi:hypothetical protein